MSYNLHVIDGVILPFDKNWDSIAIGLSGGADSALLAYLLCSHAHAKMTIHIISHTRMWKTRPWQSHDSARVFDWLTKKFPNLKLVRHTNFIAPDVEYGNMGIGLIKPNTILKFTKQDKLLNLYVDNEKLIYKVIHHNFIGLLQTLEITNGKTYINWVNISPLNLSNYRESGIYKATKDKIEEIKVEIKSKDTNKILELLSDNLL
jgi:hypothetical protein